ncbi:methyl-accepting chemotaxis protein, partial [Bacteroidota bacterium]
DLANALKISTEYFREVIELANQISKGNLTKEIVNTLDSKKGELIDSLKEMVMQLRQIAENVKINTKEIMHASDNLKMNADKINEGANQQELFTMEVSQSMVKIEKISENAAKNIIEGTEKVSETVSSMKNIVDKTKVIDSIYSKTNFIAVNAAVEAARADKYGKGFAIVAKEIQKLAEQSKHAASDIDNLSQSSISNAQNSISNLKQIIEEILKTSQLIKEISGSENIINSSQKNGHSNILKLKEITANNLLISNEILINAEELAERTIVLNDMLEFFQVD